MKKSLVFGLIVLLCIAITSCTPVKEQGGETTNPILTTTNSLTESTAIDYGPPIITPPDKIVKIKENDIQETLPYERQFRVLFYGLYSPYSSLTGFEEHNKFGEKYFESHPFEIEIQEMLLVTYVKYFNIPREDFEKALEEDWQQKKEWGFDMAQEGNELPNPDILYTFDNEIINAYYRRENPVAPDWLGTERAKDFTYESYSAYLEANPE